MENKEYIGKVLILNGSPHEHGSTYTALKAVADSLTESGIDAEIVNVGKDGHVGCTACGACKKLGKCVHADVNVIAEKLESADGLVIGSPVYYASPNGNLFGLLDRLFYSSSRQSKYMKVGAAVVSARRGGCSATFDALNKYFTISNMPIVSSNYWNQIHGSCAEDAEGDLEGLQTMRTLGKNMAFLSKAIKMAKNEIGFPETESKIYTNFIR